jgi:hypothetical protein
LRGKADIAILSWILKLKLKLEEGGVGFVEAELRLAR